MSNQLPMHTMTLFQADRIYRSGRIDERGEIMDEFIDYNESKGNRCLTALQIVNNRDLRIGENHVLRNFSTTHETSEESFFEWLCNDSNISKFTKWFLLALLPVGMLIGVAIGYMEWASNLPHVGVGV